MGGSVHQPGISKELAEQHINQEAAMMQRIHALLGKEAFYNAAMSDDWRCELAKEIAKHRTEFRQALGL